MITRRSFILSGSLGTIGAFVAAKLAARNRCDYCQIDLSAIVNSETQQQAITHCPSCGLNLSRRAFDIRLPVHKMKRLLKVRTSKLIPFPQAKFLRQNDQHRSFTFDQVKL